MCSIIILLKVLPYLPWANELTCFHAPHVMMTFNWASTASKLIFLSLNMIRIIDLWFKPIVNVSSFLINTLRPRQNGRFLPDDILKWIFLNENVWILIRISLKFVPRGPSNNIPELFLIMAWHRPGNYPLSEPIMVVYQCIYASLGLNEFTH